MNFKSHAIGGAVAATVVTSASVLILGQNSIPITSPGILFSLCFFMSLFPDLDTASIPQRLFYRALAPIFVYIYHYHGKDFLFLVAFLSIMPLMDRHRGWTHWKGTPFMLSLTALYFYDSSRGFYAIEKNILIFNYILFISSIVVGHYTHLLLDSKHVKIFGNSKDHH